MNEGTPDGASGKGLALARALEGHGVPYAIGGALAYNFWGVPRTTLDVDINAFVEPAELGRVFSVLTELAIPHDPKRATDEAEAGGMFMVWWGPTRIDVFTPSIPFSWEAMRTRLRCTLEGQVVQVLAPEALAVFKLLFFRSKDFADLERMLVNQRGKLDTAYVRRHMVEMMGEDDERVQKWDALVAEFGTPASS